MWLGSGRARAEQGEQSEGECRSPVKDDGALDPNGRWRWWEVVRPSWLVPVLRVNCYILREFASQLWNMPWLKIKFYKPTIYYVIVLHINCNRKLNYINLQFKILYWKWIWISSLLNCLYLILLSFIIISAAEVTFVYSLPVALKWDAAVHLFPVLYPVTLH